jgi:hypothetical protein
MRIVQVASYQVARSQATIDATIDKEQTANRRQTKATNKRTQEAARDFIKTNNSIFNRLNL